MAVIRAPCSEAWSRGRLSNFGCTFTDLRDQLEYGAPPCASGSNVIGWRACCRIALRRGRARSEHLLGDHVRWIRRVLEPWWRLMRDHFARYREFTAWSSPQSADTFTKFRFAQTSDCDLYRTFFCLGRSSRGLLPMASTFTIAFF